MIPLPYKILALILIVSGVFGFGYYKGVQSEKHAAQKQVIKQQAEAAKLVEERQEVTTKVEKVYVDRTRTVYVTKEKTKEAINEVHTDIIVPTELVRLYNDFVRKSSGNADTTGSANVEADGIERNLTDVFGRLIDNAFIAE